MIVCDSIHLTPQLQLEYQWGGKYGGANCNACSGGQLAQIASCGKYLFTGAQVRAASNEPIPDPASPGLNHTQTKNAIYKLSGGKIDLIVLNDYTFDYAKRRALAGAPFDLSIKRSVLVNAGYGFGNSFGGGHDITVFVVDGKVHFADPLTGVHEGDWSVLKRAAGELVIDPKTGKQAGFGRAWVMFGPDITATFSVSFTTGAFFQYHVDGKPFTDSRGVYYGGTITPAPGYRDGRKSVAFSAPTSSACSAPVPYRWPGHTSRRLVTLPSGRHVAVPQNAVHLEVYP